MFTLRFQPRQAALLFLLTATLSSCVGPRLAYRIEGPLNKNAAGEQSTLPLIPFLVRADAKRTFNSSDYATLTQSALPSSIHRLEKVVLHPRDEKKKDHDRGVIKITEPLEGYDYLGIVGNFNAHEGDGWRELVPLAELHSYALKIRGHSLVWRPEPQK